MRGQQKMTWVKLYITGWLHGSIRYQMEPDERSVWADLIALAGQCLSGGKICDNSGTAFPRQYIANQLNISLELLERTIDKCKKEGRLHESKGVLSIANWTIYQSEYERQKKYRHKKDIRQSPYETREQFKERLKLFNAPEEPPEDEREFKEHSDDLVKQSINYQGSNKE